MKKTNKGFSLVELIIVIAIMAILAGAIAPALIRYIDKSRRSNDVNSCKTIKTAIETAMGTEDVYTILTTPDTNGQTRVHVLPNTKVATTTTTAVVIEQTGTIPSDVTMSVNRAAYIIASNIGEKTPKLKYKKAADGDHKADPSKGFYGFVSKQGTVYVVIPQENSDPKTVAVDESTKKATCTGGYVICPEVDENYQ